MFKKMILAAALVACGGTTTNSTTVTSAQWDPTTSAALRDEPRVVLKQFDAGNFEPLLAKLDDNAVVLDLDDSNKPVRLEGKEKVRAYFGGLSQAMKTQGLKFETAVGPTQCSATANVGFCVFEMNQTASAGGKPLGASKFSVTIVTRKVGDEWKWSLWHASLAGGT